MKNFCVLDVYVCICSFCSYFYLYFCFTYFIIIFYFFILSVLFSVFVLLHQLTFWSVKVFLSVRSRDGTHRVIIRPWSCSGISSVWRGQIDLRISLVPALRSGELYSLSLTYLTQTQQQHRCHWWLEEQQEVMQQRQHGGRVLGDGDVRVGQRDVADVFRQSADAVNHG